MSSRSYTSVWILLFLYILGLQAHGQIGVVGRTSQGKLRFDATEEFLIDGSHKIRLVPLSAVRLSVNDIKHLSKIELQGAGYLRRRGDGRIVQRNLVSGDTAFVIPEDFVGSGTLSTSELPARFRIGTSANKKSKQVTEILPEEFFCFLPGSQPDLAVFNVLFIPKAFDSVDEQLAAIEGFVQSFPKSDQKAALRAKLEEIISDGLKDFENGGSFDHLLVTDRFAKAAENVLAGQGSVDTLYHDTEAKVAFVKKSVRNLRALGAAEDWDSFLSAYNKFELYQSSFPDLVALRHTALEESARAHAQYGRSLAAHDDYAAALKEISTAQSRDPENQVTAKLLESLRMRDSEIVARQRTSTRTVLAKDSPEDRQFRRSLFIADRAISDKDVAKAEAAIRDAEALAPGAPEVLLMRALLLEQGGRFTEALSMLDEYDRSVTEISDRDKGETLRDQLLYDLGKRRASMNAELGDLFSAGRYTELMKAASDALTLDPNDQVFLYYAAVSHAVLGDVENASTFLQRYLKTSNSLNGNTKWREIAYKLTSVSRRHATAEHGCSSGRPSSSGAVYCIESGIFVPMIESISGYKMRMSFAWLGTTLQSITTTFEDEKGLSSYSDLNRARSDKAEKLGNFWFLYAPGTQRLEAVTDRQPLHQLAFNEVDVINSKDQGAWLADEAGDPRIVLFDHPQIDVAAADVLYGNVSTVISGNSFFNPFVWDGVHYFSPEYSDDGHLISASERGADNVVKFSWEESRLTEVKAFHRGSETPYYQRTIAYSDEGIASESYSSNGKSGKIKYIYSDSKLQEAKLEDEGVHDGKTWTIRMR